MKNLKILATKSSRSRLIYLFSAVAMTLMTALFVWQSTGHMQSLSKSEVDGTAIKGPDAVNRPEVGSTCSPAPVGLISAWSGDGNALDARSRNNGTIQGNVTFAAGEVGQGFQLAGNNGDRVLVGNPPNLQSQNFTVEGWIKRSSASTVTNSPNPGSPSGVFFAYGQGGYAFLIEQNSNKLGISQIGISQILTPNLTITDTNFHHIAVTKSGSQVTFSVDGVADTPVAYNVNFAFTSNAAIGSRGDGQTDNVFFGAVDELAIYDRPLSPGQIQSIFNSGMTGKCKPLATYAPDNQVLWLTGDGNANDISGNGNNGTLQGGTGFVVSKVGQGFSFDGATGSIVQIPNSASVSFNQTAPMSVEMWVYRTSAAQIQHFIGKRTGSCGTANFNYQFALNTTNGEGLSFGGGPSAGGTPAISGQDLPLNTWTHLTGTSDGSTVRLYINGVQAASANGTLGTPNTAPLTIGDSGGCGAFGGRIDETSIYNRALSPAEITSIFNADLAGKLKTVTTPAGSNVATAVGDTTVTLPTVSTAGTTQEIPLNLLLFPALPSGTPTGLTYDVATSAAFTGSPSVCFNLPSFTTMQFPNLRIYHLEAGIWVNRTASVNTYPTLCSTGLTTLSPFAIGMLAPSAAGVTVSGRVLTAEGRGLRNARVTITDQSGVSRTVVTSSFGYYTFTDVEVGQTYLIGVASKRYHFTPRLLQVVDSLSDVDFTAIQ